MAEAQLGQDAAGFFFNPVSDLSTVEAAGGELAFGLDVFVRNGMAPRLERSRWKLRRRGAFWADYYECRILN